MSFDIASSMLRLVTLTHISAVDHFSNVNFYVKLNAKHKSFIAIFEDDQLSFRRLQVSKFEVQSPRLVVN